MTLTCFQDHIITENIWFVWSETSYSGDERRCHRCGTTNEQTNIEDRYSANGSWRPSFAKTVLLARGGFPNYCQTFIINFSFPSLSMFAISDIVLSYGFQFSFCISVILLRECTNLNKEWASMSIAQTCSVLGIPFFSNQGSPWKNARKSTQRCARFTCIDCIQCIDCIDSGDCRDCRDCIDFGDCRMYGLQRL